MGTAATPGGLQIEIEQEYMLDLDRVYGFGNSDDPLGADSTGQGNKSITLTYEQPNVEIVQDIFVEVELIQDFTQTQDIVQEVSQPIAATGTRLVSE